MRHLSGFRLWIVSILCLAVLFVLPSAGKAIAEPATGGSGNSVIEDTTGDVGTNPAFTDIVKAKVTQLGRDRIVILHGARCSSAP